MLTGEETSEDPALGVPPAEEDSGKRAEKEQPPRQELRVREVTSRKDFERREHSSKTQNEPLSEAMDESKVGKDTAVAWKRRSPAGSRPHTGRGEGTQKHTEWTGVAPVTATASVTAAAGSPRRAAPRAGRGTWQRVDG